MLAIIVIEITEVQNFQVAILEKFGLSEFQLYEKYRTTYSYHNTHIMLDELPFGNFIEVDKKDGTTEHYAFVSGLGLTTDDVVRVITSSGAGYGDPKKRDRAAVALDIKNGFITPERAKEIHDYKGDAS